MSVMQIVKDNPIPVGIGVVVLILLISASRSSGGGGGGQANAANYLASQKLAADSNNSLAALNAQVEIAKGAQSVERTKVQESAAAARANVAASMFQTTTMAGAQVGMNNSNNMVKQIQLGFANKQNLQALSNTMETEKAVINAKVMMTREGLAANQKAIETDNNFRLNSIAPLAWAEASRIQNLAWANESAVKTQSNADLAKVSKVGELAMNMQNSAQWFQEKSMPMAMAHEQEMARINTTGKTDLARIMNAAEMTDAETRQSKMKRDDNREWVKSIASIIGSFFGG